MKALINLLLIGGTLVSTTGCCLHRNWYGSGYQQAPCGPCGTSGGAYYAPQASPCPTGQCAPSYGAPSNTYMVPQGAMGNGMPMTSMQGTPAAFSTAMLPADPLPTY